MSQAQRFSIGLNSGEYGGRKMSRQCAADAIATSLRFLWKEALSIAIADPRGKEDSSISWNHFSKRELSIVPLYCIDATIEWSIFAATRLALGYFFPEKCRIYAHPLLHEHRDDIIIHLYRFRRHTPSALAVFPLSPAGRPLPWQDSVHGTKLSFFTCDVQPFRGLINSCRPT